MQIFSIRAVTLTTVTTLSCGAALSAAPQKTEYVPSGQINLQRKFLSHNVRMIGFTQQGTFVISVLKYNSVTSGEVIQWSVKTARTARRISFSRTFAPFFLALSFDGNWLLSAENTHDPLVTHNNAHLVVIRPSVKDGLIHTINIGTRNDIMGILPSPEDDSRVVLRMDSLLPYRNTFIYGKNRLSWLNLRTGRIDKTLLYYPANEVDSLVASPDKKYLLGLFYSEALDPYGESDYAPLVGQLEREGFVDVLDPKTGKILWHLASTDKQPVGEPLFFISPTRFISSDTLFNIATRTSRHWDAITPTRKCLAAIPGHSNCALFLTPDGLQMRDWQKDKLLVSWPTIKKSGRIIFSPDLKMFAFKRGSLIQFWKFDPKWLR